MSTKRSRVEYGERKIELPMASSSLSPSIVKSKFIPPAGSEIRRIATQKGVPIPVWSNIVEPYLIETPSCENITQNGRRCQRAFRYRSLIPKPIVDCRNYCSSNCLAWIPYIFQTPPTQLAYTLPNQYFSEDKERMIKFDICESKLGKQRWWPPENLNFENIAIVNLRVLLVSCPTRRAHFSASRKDSKDSKEWHIQTRDFKEKIPDEQYQKIGKVLCDTIAREKVDKPDEKFGLYFEIDTNNYPDHLKYSGILSVLFNVPGLVWVRPPQTWFTESERLFINFLEL